MRAQVLLSTTSASLRLKVPVEFSRDVSKLSGWFLRSIPIEIDLLKIKVKRKYAKILLVLKNNEPATLSNDEISFVVDDTLFPHAIRVTAKNKTA